jgi:CTP:molybdopterin cytidylyltransferase MocA
MGRSKAALELQGRSFLALCVALAFDALGEHAQVFVVEGAHPLEDLLDAQPRPTLIRNEGWQDGPLSSLQSALSHPAAHARACLVLSVDRPHISARTLETLLRAYEGEPDAIWQPRFDGRRGHPILWPADLVEELRRLPRSASPRELMARPEVQARRAFVPVDDPAILDNIDDPEAYARLRGLTS